MEQSHSSSLAISFVKRSRERELISLSGLTFRAARRAFEKAYVRFVLDMEKGNRRRSSRRARISGDMLRRHIVRWNLRQEFPASMSAHKYEFTFTMPPEDYLLFTGTLQELEDYYVIQVVLESDGNQKGVYRILGNNQYVGKVIKRALNRPNVDSLARKIMAEKLLFSGTLAQLRMHYTKQVVDQCKKDKKAAQRRLGIDNDNTFKSILLRGRLGRSLNKRVQKEASN